MKFNIQGPKNYDSTPCWSTGNLRPGSNAKITRLKHLIHQLSGVLGNPVYDFGLIMRDTVWHIVQFCFALLTI